MSVWLSSDKPCNASGGYSWVNAGDVVKVDDRTAHDLLRIPGFSRADEPAPAKRGPGRPKKTPVEEDTLL